jgi:hypothetical protein
MIFLGLYCILLVFIGFGLWFILENHFVRMDKAWSTSIQKIISTNIPTIIGTMKGEKFEEGFIAHCLLSFRQFIKWRRYLTFLDFVLYLTWIIEFGVFIYMFFSNNLEPVEGAVVVSTIIFQVVVYCRVSFLNWFHTNWRDPTVQLCLAFCELDRRLVVAQRPGGPAQRVAPSAHLDSGEIEHH